MAFPTETSSQVNSNNHGILSITIKSVSVLHSSYMPYIENGALFIPTNKEYALGDEVFILITLLDEPEQIPLVGTVIWITPANAQGRKSSGIGVQFSNKDDEVKSKIENHLTGLLTSEKTTHTM